MQGRPLVRAVARQHEGGGLSSTDGMRGGQEILSDLGGIDEGAVWALGSVFPGFDSAAPGAAAEVQRPPGGGSTSRLTNNPAESVTVVTSTVPRSSTAR